MAAVDEGSGGGGRRWGVEKVGGGGGRRWGLEKGAVEEEKAKEPRRREISREEHGGNREMAAGL